MPVCIFQQLSLTVQFIVDKSVIHQVVDYWADQSNSTDLDYPRIMNKGNVVYTRWKRELLLSFIYTNCLPGTLTKTLNMLS